MKKYINNLLASTTGTAADMTHNLCLAGGGDMGAGIRNLWFDGYSSGTIATAAILGGGYLIYWFASKKRRTLKKVEVIGTAFNKGYEVGQRLERDYREWLKEKGDDLNDAENEVCFHHG